MSSLRSFSGFLMTVEPLHIGTGAYRLSRVDLPIVRDPATDLPKIPGTTLSGVARAYAALIRSNGNGPPRCAGQRDHCGVCEICTTFGAMTKKAGTKEEGIAYAGMVSFFDARLVLFPVSTMAGPVWTTSPGALRSAGMEPPGQPEEAEVLFSTSWPTGRLNFGWLLLPTRELKLPDGFLGEVPSEVRDVLIRRFAILSDSVFAQVVKSNLEVRTSVSIDPSTGAAREGALFTYEAVPRGAFFFFELLENRFRGYWPESENHWTSPAAVAWDGLLLADRLGLGGMGTRGFGRLRLFGKAPVDSSEGGDK